MTPGTPSGRAASLLLALALAVGCQRGPPPVDPELHLTRALCTRAEQALAAGDTREAARQARLALDRRPGTAERGRARAVLGRAEGDAVLLAGALADLEPLGPGEALADLRQDLAERSLAAGDPAAALTQLLALRAELGSPDVRRATDPAALILREVRVEHGLAEAQRALGRAAEALQHQRQAALLLTRIPNELVAPLRVDVRLALGHDWLRAGDPGQSFQWHARAAALALEVPLPERRLAALVGLADALHAMGRARDALAEAERALALAESLGDVRTGDALRQRRQRWSSVTTPP